MTVVVFGVCPRKAACNSIGRSFNKVGKRCNSNDLSSKLEADVGELRAKLGVGSAMMWILINTPGPTGVEGAGGTGGPGCGARGRWRGLAGQRADAPSRTPAHQAPLVWRAPEGPEGTGGLRGAAPNEVRPPSLAGGRGLRRPEHPWGHKKHQHSQLHSNMPKSHMRNMRAS